MDETGFQAYERVLSASKCEELAAVRASPQLARSRAGARHLMSHATVAAIASSERLATIARAALGGSAVPYRATLFEKSGASNWLVVWHQDTALPLVERFDALDWGPWSQKAGIHYAHAPTWALAQIVALRLHLDDCGTDNGPLRVIPGSHALGVLSDEEVFRVSKEQSSVDCLVPRGGVLAMRPLLIHCSPKAASAAPRRVLHIEYAVRLDLAGGIRLAVA
jgi:ectoine hydroxylase-related dioxygenase (phytanoyl-CoA dioxygenase family)